MTERRSASAPVLLCIGPSHKTASLAAREKFALMGSAAVELVGDLMRHPDVLEIVPVATCNRSELYIAATDADTVVPAVVAAFARFADADPTELSTLLAVREGRSAAEYLLRVAAGTESVVIGEAQIQGQLRTSLAEARGRGSVGPVLDRLFASALVAGKRVRSETQIGSGHASIGSVATELVEQSLGSLEHKRVLVIGAGKLSTLTARTLRARGAASVVVANRNPARAAHLAEQCGGVAVTFDQLDDELVTCDVVIATTAAPHYVLTVERVEAALRRRGDRAVVLVDLAVPRDIDPQVGALPGCHLHDLDDLERMVNQTLSVREGELEVAQTIVQEELEAFEQWQHQRGAGPAIARLRDAAEAIRVRELERVLARLGHLAPEDRRRIEQLSRSIVNKLLHEPTLQLRADGAAVTASAALDRVTAGLLAADLS